MAPRSSYSSSDDEYPTAILVKAKTSQSRHGSASGAHHTRSSGGSVHVAGDYLKLPGDTGRHRSSSTGHAPQPQFVNVIQSGSRSPSPNRSRERRRPHSYGRRSSSSSSEEIRYRDHHRHHRGSRDRDIDRQLDRLKLLEEKEDEREYEKRLKHDLEIKKAKELLEKQEREEKEKALREKYVADWKREEAEKKEKDKAKKEEEDAKFEERLKMEFLAAGYSHEHIQRILIKRREKTVENSKAIDLSRPTYIKVHRKWLSPDTLDHYDLPWEWDEKDSTYIIIKTWISHDFQEELFAHTKKLKEKKLIMGPITKETTTKLMVNDGQRDQKYLVRRKSKSPGRNWMFT